MSFSEKWRGKNELFVSFGYFSGFANRQENCHSGCRPAAGANLLPVESIYRWQGEIVDEQETAALFKIRSADFPLFRQFIIEQHPYEVPCIVRYEIAEGNAEYLNWIKETTQRESV